MQYAKIICLECPQYARCPKLTRLFVNYCGSRSEKFVKDVHKAVDECHSRRSMIFKQFPLVERFSKAG